MRAVCRCAGTSTVGLLVCKWFDMLKYFDTLYRLRKYIACPAKDARVGITKARTSFLVGKPLHGEVARRVVESWTTKRGSSTAGVALYFLFHIFSAWSSRGTSQIFAFAASNE